ncbi:hypothetical protein [Paraclostridium sordellii]|nr:hypothetical protein [Paeniclostridium sordellii]
MLGENFTMHVYTGYIFIGVIVYQVNTIIYRSTVYTLCERSIY